MLIHFNTYNILTFILNSIIIYFKYIKLKFNLYKPIIVYSVNVFIIFFIFKEN
jgi:hypothetical protein